MNENLDLTKILDGCPPGTEFYHLFYGQVALIEVIKDEYPIVLEPINEFIRTTLTKDGRLNNRYDGECLLYPSKTQRDWSKFERFWDKQKKKFDPKTLKPFDKVLVRNDSLGSWRCDLLSHFNKFSGDPLFISTQYWRECVPYNEDTKYLLGTKYEASEYYKWWKDE